ncbi:MAG: diguanylate cyclase [Candidatus Brocadiaceae bacterium]|uniref:diguanylate cyclase n=1 Tax=Candidatus Wunengus sp. YC61 TaxID=3367698 RepID=UPI0027196659|nr:diguanylate cyclase [Candidatus Brocadiaceae bacterium]
MLRPYAGRTAKTGFVEVFSNFLYNKDMRVGQRLGIGFGIILLLMVGMAVFVSLSLNRIWKTQNVVNIHTSNTKTVDELEKNIEHWLLTIEHIIKGRDLSQIDYHEVLETSIAGKLKEINMNVYEEKTQNLLDEVLRLYNTLEKLDTTVQMYLRLGNNAPETINIDDATKVFEEDAVRFVRVLDNLKETITESYKQIISYSNRIEGNCWLAIYIVGAITIIFSIVYAFVTTRSITNPLKLLCAATIRIINGSFDVKLNTKSLHEIEELLNSFNIMSLKLNESYKRLETLSIIDKLTGLYNRRYFDESIEREVLRAKRFKNNLSLLFIDIDKFKHFNDTYGHAEGDAVLQFLGRLIKEQVRNEIDIACRYGGEEFTIILPETASSNATVIADRLIMDFKSIKFHIPSKNETAQKTISIGIADLNSSNGAQALLVNADKAMYEAKKLGGNKVCEYQA